MIIFFIPMAVIFFLLVASIGVGHEIWNFEIMPIISWTCFVLAIVGLIVALVKEDDSRKGAAVMAVIFFVAFLMTSCSSNRTTGDVLTWVWYHI